MQNFIDVKIVEDRRFWSYDSGRSGGGKCLLLGCARDYPLMGFYKSPHPHLSIYLSFSTCRYISQSLQLSASLSKHRTFYLSLSHSLSLSFALVVPPFLSLRPSLPSSVSVYANFSLHYSFTSFFLSLILSPFLSFMSPFFFSLLSLSTTSFFSLFRSYFGHVASDILKAKANELYSLDVDIFSDKIEVVFLINFFRICFSLSSNISCNLQFFAFSYLIFEQYIFLLRTFSNSSSLSYLIQIFFIFIYVDMFYTFMSIFRLQKSEL